MNVVNEPSVLGEIRFFAGPQAGTIFRISKPYICIGRQRDNDLITSDPSTSRLHAEIIWDNGVWSINKLASQNTLTLNQHEVQQAVIHDHDVIGLGSNTKILFLDRTGKEKAPDPNIPPTAFLQTPASLPASSPSKAIDPFPKGGEGKQISSNPLSDLSNPAWQLVGLIFSAVGVFLALIALPGSTSKVAGGIVITIGLAMCFVILLRRTSKTSSHEKTPAPSPAIPAQSKEFQSKRNDRMAFRNALIVNIILIIMFGIALTVTRYSNTALGSSFIIFTIGIIISLIDLLRRIAYLVINKLIKGKIILWMSISITILMCILFVPTALTDNLGIDFAIIFTFIESVLVFILTIIVIIYTKIAKN